MKVLSIVIILGLFTNFLIISKVTSEVSPLSGRSGREVDPDEILPSTRGIKLYRRNVTRSQVFYGDQLRTLRARLIPLFNIDATSVGGIDACVFVRGVTSLSNRIYVICSKSDVMHVYDDATFEEVYQVELPGTKNLQDIHSCPNTKSIYVVESVEDSLEINVWKANISPVTRRVSEWTLWKSGKFWARSISVTPTGNVLLLTRTTLEIFDSSGSLLKSINIPNYASSSRHAVETPDGNYVICHGWNQESPHGVTLISSTGRILRFYGGNLDELSGEEELNLPSHLAVDEEGRIFVADQVNYRVLLFPPDVHAARVLLNAVEDGVVWPSRLSYDRVKQRLIVGLASGNPRISSVLIFKMSESNR